MDTDAMLEVKLHTLVVLALKLFDGVGKYGTFIHLDLRGTQARWNG